MIKSRRMRWAGHVARMGETKGCTEGFGRKTRRNTITGKIHVGGRITFKLILEKQDEVA
jgi:hypothetical protein